ncbi:MAG TPA: asparagine synthase (glutamine-hydrolyzing) [Rhodanobacteraceae bacterium]|nr:asparagine synthase (glutamine-hydrolyzing) [Rhodanobacteraceae bacterium]
MCGIAGFWDVPQRVGAEGATATLTRMTGALAHRGPDDAGAWYDPAAGLALGHRRLAIVDLSPEGHQPMTSASGRYVLVFNGEVYNHARLRKELAGLGAAFRGHSDTEVMLAAIERWGLAHALSRFNGMFAFALWDRRERALSLVRDRLGIKPLYCGWVGRRFVFASELKAITLLPDFANPVDPDALAALLGQGYIPAPRSIYRGLAKLVPGTTLTLSADDVARGAHDTELVAARSETFWSARAAARAGQRDALDASDAEAVAELDHLLRDAVALRLRADVPVGAFLSGGIDSSLVVALAQAQSTRPIQTFAIGFRETGYDEARYARAVAQHLHTDHHELYVGAQDALDVVPRLPALFDEPFADASQIPTFLVAQLARGSVTVSLSGDGGDELFAGYRRYLSARTFERALGALPRAVQVRVAHTLGRHPGVYESVLAACNVCLPGRIRLRRPRAKVALLADLLQAGSIDARARLWRAHARDPARLLRQPRAHVVAGPAAAGRHAPDAALRRMLVADLVDYLPGDILAKVDRASMAVGLEARVPLLDHRVVEHAWRVPLGQKIRRGQGKWLLRRVLDHYVPARLLDRPKQGFSVPIGAWLRGPLREWADALLDATHLREQGWFEPQRVRQLFVDHVAGRVDEGACLWDVLMFQAWLVETARTHAQLHTRVAA